MIGVNSIHSSAGRLRSRSLCSVRYGRTHRGAETLCYGWPQRSRSLKPVLYTDLVVSRLQSRKKKKAVRAVGPRPTPGWETTEGVAEGGTRLRGRLEGGAEGIASLGGSPTRTEPTGSQGWAWGGGRAETLGSSWGSQTKGSLDLLDESMRRSSPVGFRNFRRKTLWAKGSAERGRG